MAVPCPRPLDLGSSTTSVQMARNCLDLLRGFHAVGQGLHGDDGHERCDAEALAGALWNIAMSLATLIWTSQPSSEHRAPPSPDVVIVPLLLFLVSDLDR